MNGTDTDSAPRKRAITPPPCPTASAPAPQPICISCVLPGFAVRRSDAMTSCSPTPSPARQAAISADSPARVEPPVSPAPADDGRRSAAPTNTALFKSAYGAEVLAKVSEEIASTARPRRQSRPASTAIVMASSSHPHIERSPLPRPFNAGNAQACAPAMAARCRRRRGMKAPKEVMPVTVCM